MKSLKSYLTSDIAHSKFRYILLLLFSFSFAVQAAPPAFTEVFTPSIIGSGNQSLLTFSITNNDGVGVRDISFTNVLPADLTIVGSNSTTCSNGTLLAVKNDNVITFSDASLPANSSCTVSVNVTSSIVGTHTNITGDLTSDQGNSGTATSDLTVDANYVTFAMALSPNAITQGETSTLTIDISNPRASFDSAIRTSIALPNGLAVASQSNLISNCNDTSGTTTASGTAIILSSSFFAAASSCQITVDVVSSMAVGEFLVSSSISGQFGDYGSASASIDVSQAFAVMSFNPNPVIPNSTSTLSITLTNYDRANDATNISFSDDLDAALSGLVATGLPLSNVCGTGSSLTGTSTILLTGGNIVAGGSCTIEVPIAIPANAAQGTYTNTTSTFTVDGISNVSTQAVSGQLYVTQGPQVTMSFQQASYTAGAEALVDFTITNIDLVNDATNIAFTSIISDFTSVGPTNIISLPAAGQCGAGSTFSAATVSGTDYVFNVSDANIVAGANCSFTLGITLPEGMSSGIYQLTTSDLTSTINGVNIVSAQAADSIEVISAPSLAFSIVEDYASPSSTINAEFTLTHSLNASTDATDIGFTLDLNSVMPGLAYANASLSNICGSGSTFAGGAILTFASGSLAPGDSCNFSIQLTLPASVTPGSYVFSSSKVTATVSGLTPMSLAASDTLTLSGLTFTKQFLAGPFLPGETIVARYTIENSVAAGDATDIVFTDNLSSALSSLQAVSLPPTPCGAGSSITGTTFLVFTQGALVSGDSCTFDISILVPAGASEGSYNSPTSNVSATVNGNNTSNANAVDTLVIETLTVGLSSANAPSTMISPFTVNIDFSRDIVNFIIADLVITNGSASNLSGSGASYFVDITPAGDGTVLIELPANVVDDAVDGNVKNPAAIALSIEYAAPIANATPSLVISNPSQTLTSSTDVSYNVTYTNAAEVNLTSAAISLNQSGTANAQVAVTNGGSDNPTITLSNFTGDGTLGIAINAGTARNGTNQAPMAGPSVTFTVDNTAPSIAITSSAANPTNSAFTAAFDFTDPATGNIDAGIVGFDSSDISLVNATLTNFSGSAGSYSATVNPINDGVVTLNIAAGVAQDASGNANTIATTFSLVFDSTAPTVGIALTATNPNNSTFTAAFDFTDPTTGNVDTGIVGFDSSDISLSNATLTSFSGSAGSYSATFNSINDGVVTLNVAAGVAQDASGNANTPASTFTLIADSTAPSVAITLIATNPNNSTFTAAFDFTDPTTGNIDTGIVGFDSSDIALTNATLTNFSGSAGSYSATINSINDGVVTLDIAAGIAQDANGNANTPASTFTLIADSTAPSVAITLIATNPNNTTFTAAFDFTDPTTGNIDTGIVGFDSSDIALTNATLTNFAGSAGSYSATINSINDGVVTLDIAAGIAQDANGNANTPANTFSLIADSTAPSVVITLIATNPNNSTFTAAFDFTDPTTGNIDTGVVGFDSADISLTNATLTNFAGSAGSYSATINPINDGVVTLDIAAGVAQDANGNANTAATSFSLLIDTDAPSVAITSTAANPNNSSFTAVFDFTDLATGNIDTGIIGFDSSDISLSNATLTNFAGSAGSYSATINPINDGVVTLNIAAGVAQDANGNANTAATTFSLIYDKTKPAVEITADTPVSTAFLATIEFSEDIADFIVTDLSVTNAALSQFSAQSNSLFTVLVTPNTDGEVTLAVLASVAVDAAGNTNLASNTLVIDYDPRELSLVSTSPEDDSTVGNDVTISFTFNKDIHAVSGANKLIEIFKQDSSSALYVIPVVSSDVDVTNSTVTILTPFTLEPGSSYYVLVSAGAFVDDANNTFSGISDNSVFNFSVAVDSPIAHDDQVQGVEDNFIAIDVLANDTNTGGSLDPATITLVKLAQHGSLTIAAGKVSYQPEDDFFGTDSFSYTVKNLQGLVSNEATVDITIIAKNDIPVFTSEPLLYVAPLSPYVYQVTAVDADFDVLTFDVTRLPAWLSFDGVNTLSGIPTINELGESFEVVITVTDGFIDTVIEQKFNVVVTNDGPAGLSLVQSSSENPILVGTSTTLRYSVENNGIEVVFLNQLYIELTKDIVVDAMPPACSVGSNTIHHDITCILPGQLQIGASAEFELSVSTPVYGIGEVTSKMIVAEQSTGYEYTDTMITIISEEINNQAGELLSAFSTSSHAFGDINGDGFIDLVIGNLAAEPNQVLFNTGFGKFETSQSFGDGTDTRDIALVDINNDEALDIVVANSSGTASGYYLNNGEGLFDEIYVLSTMNNTGVAFGDFNADNLIDVVFSNDQGSESSIFTQPFVPATSTEYPSSKSTTSASPANEISHATVVETGDFNGDSYVDIAFGYDVRSLKVLLNDGTGTFTVKTIEAYDDISYLVVADINKDDKDDILLSYRQGTAAVMGGEEFTNTFNISSILASSIAIADVDEDNILDIMLLSSPGVITKYAVNSENEVIKSNKSVAVNGATGLGLIDVDSDGDIDLLLTSNISTTENEIRYNQGSGSFGAQTVDLDVSLSSVTDILVNSNYQLTIGFVNSGMADAKEIVLEYEVINGTLISIADTSLECELTAATLRCSALTLAVGDAMSIVLNLDATALGVARHSVAISTTSVDDNSLNNQATTQVTVRNEVVKEKRSSGSVPPMLFLALIVLYFRRSLSSKALG